MTAAAQANALAEVTALQLATASHSLHVVPSS